MDRVWLLSWTTYGSRLPGDARGFVGEFFQNGDKVARRNGPGTLPASDHPDLAAAARAAMRGPTVRLKANHAPHLIEQFRVTATYRAWSLATVAVMAGHIHLVVGVNGDPEPDTLLRDFKSYGSGRLNRLFGKPSSGTWWTQGGSRRVLAGDEAVRAAVSYVESQDDILATWSLVM